MTDFRQQARSKKTCADIGNRVKQLRQARNISLNELSRLSGVSKAALSKLESGGANPRVDTLDAIAVALRLPLGDLLSGPEARYPFLERATPQSGDYLQEIKFRINQGNVAEIWHLRMNPGATIDSPAHTPGTHEHILVHEGVLILCLAGEEPIALRAGDFYAFAGHEPHLYRCEDETLSATVVMAYPLPG